MPENSRYIDYSKSDRPGYLCSQGTSFASCWSYNGKFWVNRNNKGEHTFMSINSYLDDHSTLTHSDYRYEIQDFCNDGWATKGTTSSRKMRQYYSLGLLRTYTSVDHFYTYFLANGILNDYNGGAVGTISLIMQTLTLSINAILHHAYYDGEAHESEWYVDESNQQTHDASEAAKNATKKALSV